MQRRSFERLLGILGSVLDAHSACLFLNNRRGGQEKALQSCSLSSSFSLSNSINTSAQIAEGKGLVGWIIRNREPLLVSNFDQRQNYLGYYSENEEQFIKAFMGCPLPQGLGALCVDSKRQYSFAEKDQKMLHLFADLFGYMYSEIAEINEKNIIAKYFSAQRTILNLRHTYSKWSEFLKIFLNLLVSVTGFSYGVLFVLENSGETFSVEGETELLLQQPGVPDSFPLASGIAGWVFRHATPVINSSLHLSSEHLLVTKNDSTSPFYTVFALPLIIHRKTRGVLALGHKESVPVDEHTREFVIMAGEYLSLFLENLYVKSQLKKAHQELHSYQE